MAGPAAAMERRVALRPGNAMQRAQARSKQAATQHAKQASKQASKQAGPSKAHPPTHMGGNDSNGQPWPHTTNTWPPPILLSLTQTAGVGGLGASNGSWSLCMTPFVGWTDGSMAGGGCAWGLAAKHQHRRRQRPGCFARVCAAVLSNTALHRRTMRGFLWSSSTPRRPRRSAHRPGPGSPPAQ